MRLSLSITNCSWPTGPTLVVLSGGRAWLGIITDGPWTGEAVGAWARRYAGC